MSNNDYSIRLKATEQGRPTSSTRRSRSVSRGADSIANRNLQEQRLKYNQQQEIKQDSRSNKNRSSLSKGKSTYKKKKPVNEYWDEDGFLIDTRQNENQQKNIKYDENLSNKSYINSRSIAILVSSRQSLNLSIVETAEQSPKSQKSTDTSQKSQRKRAPSVQESRANFNKFIERQRESAEKHILVENNTNQEGRFMNKESKLILKRANKQNSSIMQDSQRRRKDPHPKEEEFTYHPDLSLTLHSKNVTGLSCQFSEAKAVIKDIQMTAIKVEQEAIDMKDCTYKPDLISDPKIMERAKANRDKINQRKKEKKEEIEKSAHKADEEEECKTVRFCKKIPTRTKELNEMLRVFRKAGNEQKNVDEDEGA